MTELIKQRNMTDCGICCLAMCFSVTYEEILSRAEDYVFRLSWGCDKGLATIEERQIVESFGHAVRSLIWWHFENNGGDFWRALEGNRALLSVPSLNIEDGLHLVYWDGTKLLDPSNLKTYTRETIPKQCRAFIIMPAEAAA
ncbi:MAG: hypothetical protein ACAH80_18535 [Alphaproteobacteria bacterium]